MLYIANMGCSRISVCLVIKKALPGRVPRYAALGFATFTALWMVSGVLVTAFACSLPNPWQFIRNNHRSTECYDVVTFVNYIGITNIVVEIILVIIPLVVWNVKLSAAKRVSVSLVFLARLGFVLTTIVSHSEADIRQRRCCCSRTTLLLGPLAII